MAKITLTAEQEVELKQAQRALHDVLSEIDKAERCGIDCMQYRAVQQSAASSIQNLLAQYGSGS